MAGERTRAPAQPPHGIERIDWNGLVYYRSTRLHDLGVQHLFTTRLNTRVGPQSEWDMGYKGGADPEMVLKSRAIACEILRSDISKLTVAQQVHSGHAVLIGRHNVGRGARAACDAVADADGMATAVPRALLLVLTADCLPALLFGPGGRVGAFHAGWRGALAGIARNTVGLMAQRLGSDPNELVAVLGPAIRRCCFEVSPSVAERFAPAARRVEQEIVDVREGRLFVDLPAFVKAELIAVGLEEENIIDVGLCTCCLPELFYSYRRDGRLVGSQGAMIASGRAPLLCASAP